MRLWTKFSVVLSCLLVLSSDFVAEYPDPDLVELKVLFMYTQEALEEADSHEAIVSKTDLFVQETNDALARSDVIIRYVNAHVGSLAISEEGKTSSELLQCVKEDAWFQSWFDQYETAIQVIVTRASSTSHGFSEYTWGSFSQVGYLHSSWYFAHEVGHTLGLSHPRDNPNHYPEYSAVFRYGHSYTGDTSDQSSVMGAAQIYKFYSNPKVNYDGQPTGIAHLDDPENSADCARGLNIDADFWGNFNPDQGLKRSLTTTTKRYGSYYEPIVVVHSSFHRFDSDALGMDFVLEKEIPRSGGKRWEISDQQVVLDNDNLPVLIERNPESSLYFRTYFINLSGQKVGYAKAQYPRFPAADIDENEVIDQVDLDLYDQEPFEMNFDGVVDDLDRELFLTWLDDPERFDVFLKMFPVKIYGSHSTPLSKVTMELPYEDDATGWTFVLEKNFGESWVEASRETSLDGSVPTFLYDAMEGRYDRDKDYRFRVYIINEEGHRSNYFEVVTATPAVDVNEDCVINMEDYLEILLNPIDMNLDGQITINDKNILLTWRHEVE